MMGSKILITAVGLSLAATVAASPDLTAELRAYVRAFRAEDVERVTNAISNADAEEYLVANAPRFACPDRDVERAWAYRWWSLRKHFFKSLGGWCVSEFTDRRAIACPVGHHLTEGRWFRDRTVFDDYTRYWFRKGANPIHGPGSYVNWIVQGALAREEVTGDRALADSLLADFVANYEAWEKGWKARAWPAETMYGMGLKDDGLFHDVDDREGTELTLSGNGARVHVNAMMYGEAKGIAKIAARCGKTDVAAAFEARAARLEKCVKERLWNAEQAFFCPRRDDGTLTDVCELHGYSPWYAGMPLDGYSAAWKWFADEKRGFAAPLGLTFPVQSAKGFRIAYEGHACQWNGPSWPFATSVALTALNRTLRSGAKLPVGRAEWLAAFLKYARQHRQKTADGVVRPWIDEVQDPYTGDWIAYKRWQRDSCRNYNHSTYCDLVVTGLVGLRIAADGTCTAEPNVPDGWGWFRLEDLPVRDKLVTVTFDRDGTRFGAGKGLTVTARSRVSMDRPAPPALACVDPMIGTEGTGSEYGGMTPMTGVPFGSMHLIPVTRTNAVGRTSFNALDRELLGFILSRQPAIWMGEFGPVRIWLPKPLRMEGVEAHPWKTVVRAGGHRYELAANAHAALIRSDDTGFDAALAETGVTTERTARVSMKPIPNFACHWKKLRVGNTLAIGVSLISAENAAKFAAAVPKNVDVLAQLVKTQWFEYFRRVEVDADETVRKILYTGLYHALLYPRDLSEFGRYYSAVDDRVHEGPGYSCFSLWDTYRSEHPLLLLVAPERAAAMMQSLVDMYAWGGWLPVWPNPGYTGVMIGDPAAVVLAEAVVKGLRGFSWKDAYAAVKKNADVPQPDDATRTWLDVGNDEPGCPETRGGLTWYLKNGYVAHDRCTESVSRTLDYSLADASIARFAARLGEEGDAARYRTRSKNYTNLWHAAKKVFLPKRLDGTWADPSKLTWSDHAYTETDERSARWCVPHDVDGMVALMGGADAFERELDRFFEKDFYRTDAVGNVSVHGNETCHHVAYLYNRIGKYDKTCRRVRDILTRCYSASRKGFDGNEDCGAMSAWYIFSALGLYPLDPASGSYELGSPLVRGAKIALAGGKRLEIRVDGYAPDRWRVKRVTFNGEELASRRLAHRDLAQGGVLAFEME